MSSSRALGPYLGHLSNREYKTQNRLVKDEDDRLRFTSFTPRVRTFPTEILAEIFISCLPDGELVKPHPTTAPLVLCGVCRRWTEVALAAPKLWSSLHIDFDLAGQSEKYLQFCQMWLARSRDTPLSLSLHAKRVSTVPSNDAPVQIRPLLQTIARLSCRWRNIVVHLWPADEFLIKELFSTAKYPLLEKLAITNAIHPIALRPDDPISFCDAPRLRQIFAPIRNDALSRIRFPWTQITTFRTSDITLSRCLEILSHVSNLVDGNFEIWDDHSEVPPSILSRMHLQSLNLAGRVTVDVGGVHIAVLDRLTAPALTSLTLRFPSFNDSLGPNSVVSPFISFVTRSSFRLQSLGLSYMPATAENLIECLRAVPSLVHLKLEPLRIVDVNAIFAQLTGDSDFLPKLESLHVFFTFHTDVSASIVAEMLCWRWAAVGITRMRSFHMPQSFYRQPFQDEAVESEFRRLEKEGMDLYFGKERPGIDSFMIKAGLDFS